MEILRREPWLHSRYLQIKWGVSNSVIWNARHGKTWKEMTDPAPVPLIKDGYIKPECPDDALDDPRFPFVLLTGAKPSRG